MPTACQIFTVPSLFLPSDLFLTEYNPKPLISHINATPHPNKTIFLHPIKNYTKMEPKTIDKATSDKISFMTYIVPAFADAYKMNVQDAFFYLKNYGGWDFLTEHWWALHTDSTFWAVRSLYEVCYENGGLK